MLETVIAAAAAALISTGSAAAMAAAKRSAETRDAVLKLQGQFSALDSRMATHVIEANNHYDRLTRRLEQHESRLTALEHGWVDRRNTSRQFDTGSES